MSSRLTMTLVHCHVKANLAQTRKHRVLCSPETNLFVEGLVEHGLFSYYTRERCYRDLPIYVITCTHSNFCFQHHHHFDTHDKLRIMRGQNSLVDELLRNQ